jgi:hypothetical protein
VFTRSAGVWTQHAWLTAADGVVDDLLGWAVALSGDTALVGAPYRDTSGTDDDAGAAYVFDLAPTVRGLTPTAARRGARVVIAGDGFGARRAGGFVCFGAVKCARYLSWSPTRIRCQVPARARFSRVSVRVTTAAGRSNAKRFTVKR